jgi:hypothetical protein
LHGCAFVSVVIIEKLLWQWQRLFGDQGLSHSDLVTLDSRGRVATGDRTLRRKSAVFNIATILPWKYF